MSALEPFYFEVDGAKRYATYFPPQHAVLESGPSRGFVLCNAFGKEFDIARTQLVNFGRALASRGFAGLRFDYGGYGDSEGEIAEVGLSCMKRDVHAAIDALKARTGGIDRLCLLGLRWGGLLAAQAAAERAPGEVSELVLWEPVVAPWDYLYHELRQTVAMQSLILRTVHFNREQITANARAGRPSLAGGYDFNCIDEGFPLGAVLLDEAQANNAALAALGARIAARTLLIHVTKQPQTLMPRELGDLAMAWQEQGMRLELDVAVEPTLPWVHELRLATQAPELFHKTLDWLEAGP